MQIKENTNEFGQELAKYLVELKFKTAEAQSKGLLPMNLPEPEIVPADFSTNGELVLIFNVDIAVPEAFQNITLKTETLGPRLEED